MLEMNRRVRNLLSQDRDCRRTEVGLNLLKCTTDNGQEVLKQEDSQTKSGFTQTDKEVQVTMTDYEVIMIVIIWMMTAGIAQSRCSLSIC